MSVLCLKEIDYITAGVERDGGEDDIEVVQTRIYGLQFWQIVSRKRSPVLRAEMVFRCIRGSMKSYIS
jgi:hypothetical protein